MTGAAWFETLLPEAAGLVASVTVAVIGWLWAQRRKRRDEHAKLLGDAFAAVVAYKEFPFAVRRRDPDSPATERVRLSEAMRSVQEQLAFHMAWVRGTSRPVSDAYDALVGELRKTAGASVRAAWNGPPIATDEQMNMPEVAAEIAHLQAFEERFVTEVHRYLQPVRSRLIRPRSRRRG